MNDFYPDASKVIQLASQWVSSLEGKQPLRKCRFFLFGSAIYEQGEQFNRLLSDLDMVCLLPNGLEASERFELMQSLQECKHQLEMDLIPGLGRDNCSEPSASIVVVTEFEVLSNIHKSGARNFFDANFFLDLRSNSMQMSLLPNAGERDVSDASRQAFEYCQKIRSEYLSAAANKVGGIPVYAGASPLQKTLMRSAAQIAPVDREGQWYDTRLGLEHMRSILKNAKNRSPELAALDKKVSIRCGGNGTRGNLSADDQLLLAELLFDEASKTGSVESLNWYMRFSKVEYSIEEAHVLYGRIRAITPQVRLRGSEPGSVILRLTSPQAALNLYSKLFGSILNELLKETVSEISIDEDEIPTPADGIRGRFHTLVNLLRQWQPVFSTGWRNIEKQFADELRDLLNRTPELAGWHIRNSIDFGHLEIPYNMDYLLEWLGGEGAQDVSKIGIEVKYIQSKASFFHMASQVAQIGSPLILVFAAERETLENVERDIAQLERLKPNIAVIKFLSDASN
jgi:hypothetical protein